MHSWVNKYKTGLMKYIAPEECFVNDDGTTYSEHELDDSQWLEVLHTVSEQVASRKSRSPFPSNSTFCCSMKLFETGATFLGDDGSYKEGFDFLGAANVMLDH